MNRMILICLLGFLTSCATEFVGDAHITPKQCEAKCLGWGMEMDAMIAMGEYSDACVCKKKGSNLSSSNAAGSGAGAIGAILQARRNRQQSQTAARSF